MPDILSMRIFRRVNRIQTRISDLSRSASLPNGKSIGTQVREIIKLKLGPTKLSAKDYFWYNMGNKDIYKDVDLATFGGTFMTDDLHKRLNSSLWDAVVTDKLVMSMVFSRSGIPQPKLYAAACRFARDCGDCRMFLTEQELSEFLAAGITYPFFCKPIKGGSAVGCNRVEAYDSETRKLRLANGNHISIADFLETLVDPSGWGFLFQEAVLPHPDTIDICGDAVSGCRVVMLLHDEGARPFRVTWKIPTGKNFIDNYVGGTAGNLVADVDIETGRVTRVVSGCGASLQVNPKHPDTGSDIVGIKVPGWDDMMDMIGRASRSFPGFRFQHWDIGLTSKGPIVYELNTAGDLYVGELVKGSGTFDAELKTFVDRYADRGRRSEFVGTKPVS